MLYFAQRVGGLNGNERWLRAERMVAGNSCGAGFRTRIAGKALAARQSTVYNMVIGASALRTSTFYPANLAVAFVGGGSALTNVRAVYQQPPYGHTAT